MKFAISDRQISDRELKQQLLNHSCGACVSFEGWVRNHNDGRPVMKLEYEVYRPLAIAEGERILQEACQRFEVADAACVHREGLLELGDTAVIAAAVAAHRDEAFKACRYIIDEVKRRLPIWKREHYSDGETLWVNCQQNIKQGGTGP